MDIYDLKEVLKLHELWLIDDESGKRADLSYVNLRCEDLQSMSLSGVNFYGADLSYVNFRRADLSGTDLRNADLRRANLNGVDLSCADLDCADLRGADLSRADLSNVNLRGANLGRVDLRGVDLSSANLSKADLSEASLRSANLNRVSLRHANLREADLSNANLSGARLSCADLGDIIVNELTAMFHPVCPTEGSFVGYKKCRYNVIVKLLIPEDAKRSSATTRKCRCDKALVLETIGSKEKAISRYDETFVYKVGETVSVDDFDHDRWNECSTGIHFFMTREEAEAY